MFTLIKLPYDQSALEPVISVDTIEYHHGRHLKTYVENLNKLIAGTEFESLCHSERSEESILEEIVKNSSGAIFNNAGQILNHNLYFTQFAPAPHSGHDPESPLAKQIAKQWGTLDAFKAEFESKGTTLFGSGWVWLQANEAGELSIAQYANADNPVAHGLKPLLTFDVWEHAYYLDYQNRRAAHLQALWQIVDWSIIEERYL